MSMITEDKKGDAHESAESYKKFYQSLSEEETMLIVLRDELYNGSWENMWTDLADRLKGRPYIFKLADRIEEDLARIEKMQEYEKTHQINLKDYKNQEA